MRKIRIEGDGTLRGTRVVDAETGKQLDAVSRIVIEPLDAAELDGCGIVTATITFKFVELRLEADALFRAIVPLLSQ